jgi:AbrB family looped-hinge helix DNA binding protein
MLVVATMRETRFVRPLRSGQITIPAEFRKKLGITKDSVLEVSLEGDMLRITPIQLRPAAKDANWFKELYEMFAPVRQDAAEMTDDEVDQAIDAAIRASREAHADRP